MSVITRVRETIYKQKFEGAPDLLNQNIIARDLGLIDKKDIAVDDNRSLEEVKKRIDELLSKNN